MSAYRRSDHVDAIVDQRMAREITPDCWPRLMPAWAAWAIFIAALAICALPFAIGIAHLPVAR